MTYVIERLYTTLIKIMFDKLSILYNISRSPRSQEEAQKKEQEEEEDAGGFASFISKPIIDRYTEDDDDDIFHPFRLLLIFHIVSLGFLHPCHRQQQKHNNDMKYRNIKELERESMEHGADVIV